MFDGPDDDWPEHERGYGDGPERLKTYRNLVAMRINGRVCSIDYCIHRIVSALNAANISTVASCCGHQKLRGNIVLEDGRTLLIQPTSPVVPGVTVYGSSLPAHSVNS